MPIFEIPIVVIQAIALVIFWKFIGEISLRCVRMPRSDSIPTLDICIGLMITTMVIIVLGILGGLHVLSPWLWIPIAGCSAYAGLARRGDNAPLILRWAGHAVQRIRESPIDAFLLAAGFAILIVGTAIPQMEPDALSLHFSLPKLYLMEGRFVERPDLPLFDFTPVNWQMTYMLAMGLGGEQLASIINPICLGMILIHLSSWSREIRPGVSPLAVPVALLGSASIFFWLGYAPFIDLPALWFSALGLHLLYRWWISETGNLWIPAALIFGFAFGVKQTTALMPAVFGCVVWAGVLKKKWTATSALRYSVAGALIFLVVASPWYIRNWIFRDNPFFPYLLASRHALPDLSLLGVGEPGGNVASRLGELLHATYVYQHLWFKAPTPAKLLSLPMLLILAKRRDSSTWLALGLLCLGVAFIGYSAFPYHRLLLPYTVGILLLTALAWEHPWLRAILRGHAALLILAFAAYVIGGHRHHLLGQESREALLTRRVGSFGAIEFLNAKAVDQTRAFTFDENTYHLNVPFLFTGQRQGYLQWWLPDAPDAYADAFEEGLYTDLLITTRTVSAPDPGPDRNNPRACLGEAARRIIESSALIETYRDERFAVYSRSDRRKED